MTAATLFSGIGAPEVAMPGWRWLWHAEIEPFPSAVMAKRHRSSINLGDVTAHDFCERALAIGRPDVLVFGSPCQSYSVAGKRLGLDDPRGNLALIALGIVERLAPAWFVFENVPGLFSSYSGADEAARQVREGAIGATAEGDEDSDYAAFLSAVQNIGRAGAWAVLDAQYRGLAQRRERVFFVGCPAPAWQRAAAVLLEPESLCGHPPARSQAGQNAAPTLGAGPVGGGRRYGTCADTVEGLVPVASTGDVSHCLNAGGMGRIDYESETLVAHSLRADGFDASEDGRGRGTPLVAVFDPNQITHPENRCQPTPGLSHPLPAQANAPIAYQCQGSNVGEIGTLRAGNGNETGGVPFVFNHQASPSQTMRVSEDTVDALRTIGSPAVAFSGRSRGAEPSVNRPERPPLVNIERVGALDTVKPWNVAHGSGVRRLMPDECELLQGFRRNYTLINYRGKRAKDGPRYKAIGNSMAVPVVRWILSRIEWLEREVSV